VLVSFIVYAPPDFVANDGTKIIFQMHAALPEGHRALSHLELSKQHNRA
jgi:hypothetical protein